MAEEALELSVAGTRVRVVSSASADELRPLVELVEEKLAGVSRPGKPITKESMMLAAIALANEVVEARSQAEATRQQSKATLTSLLAKLDQVLESSDAPARARAGRRSRSGRGSSSGNGNLSSNGNQATTPNSERSKSKRRGRGAPELAEQEQVAASQRPAEKRHVARAGRASDRPTSKRD